MDIGVETKIYCLKNDGDIDVNSWNKVVTHHSRHATADQQQSNRFRNPTDYAAY